MKEKGKSIKEKTEEKPRVEKRGKEKKPKRINVKIAPLNWTRLKAHLQAFNEDEKRTGPKLKITDIINEAIKRHVKPVE
jgi:hypothetical protein